MNSFGADALTYLTDRERDFLADPALTPLFERLTSHVTEMAARGWSHADAEATLLGCILGPLFMGHADGSLNRRIRAGIDMRRRHKAADLALRLADMLDAIEREPLPPGEALCISSIVPFPNNLPPYALPSYVLTYRPSEALRRLAEGLRREPDFRDAPGLASRKPSWRDGLREVVAELQRYGFTLRECEAVTLVRAYARAVGARPPTRDSVRAALRPL